MQFYHVGKPKSVYLKMTDLTHPPLPAVSSESGTLRVYVQFNRSRADRELIFHANSSLQRWSRFSQTVNITKPFQVTPKQIKC